MAEFEAGVPIWVDVSSTDLDKTADFYTGLFGWTADRGGPEVGGYSIFKKNGKMVAGAGPTQMPEQPAAWSTYIQTDDAAATAEAVRNAGGTVIAEPMQVMDQGTLAVFQDSTGAFISVWQPGLHKGAELVNEVGSFCWNELYTRDMPRAKEFYQKAFNWQPHETDMGQMKYTLFKVGDRDIGGGMSMDDVQIPAEVPPHWLVYFTVADIAEARSKAEQLGGTHATEQMDTPMGPFSVERDPVGAVFAFIQFQSQG